MGLFDKSHYKVEVSRWAYMSEFKSRAARGLIVRTDKARYEIEFAPGGASEWRDKRGLLYLLRPVKAISCNGVDIVGAASIGFATQGGELTVHDEASTIVWRSSRISKMQVVT